MSDKKYPLQTPVYVMNELSKKNITTSEAFLLSKIAELEQLPKGCFAKDSFFAKLFGKSRKSISNHLLNLQRKGYITKKTERKGHSIPSRTLTLTNISINSGHLKEDSRRCPQNMDRCLQNMDDYLPKNNIQPPINKKLTVSAKSPKYYKLIEANKTDINKTYNNNINNNNKEEGINYRDIIDKEAVFKNKVDAVKIDKDYREKDIELIKKKLKLLKYFSTNYTKDNKDSEDTIIAIDAKLIYYAVNITIRIPYIKACIAYIKSNNKYKPAEYLIGMIEQGIVPPEINKTNKNDNRRINEF